MSPQDEGQLKRGGSTALRGAAKSGALAFVVFAVGLLAAFRLVANAATADQVELRLWPAGQGRIEVTQNGTVVPVTSDDGTLGYCDFVAILHSSECRVQVATGQPVTLNAIAEPNLSSAQVAELSAVQDSNGSLPDFPLAQSSVVGWSRAGCESGATCTFTPDSSDNDLWLTALFTPLQLEVGINGEGTVSIDGGGGSLHCNDKPHLQFGDTTCHNTFAAGTSLVLVATPKTQGTAIKWGIGCVPDNGDPASARCTVTMNNIRTFATVGFGADPPNLPFQITPRIRVKLTGSGQGRITGNGIDCGSTCSTDVGYQTRVTLKAQPSQGSSFVRWAGVCSTDPTCSFAAGSATYVEARFDAAGTTTASTTTTTQVTTTVVTTTTTTTTTTTALTARLAGVKATGTGKRRAVVATVVLNRSAKVSLRLQRNGKTVAGRTLTAPASRSSLKLAVPARAPAGRYRLLLGFTAGKAHKSVSATVRIGR